MDWRSLVTKLLGSDRGKKRFKESRDDFEDIPERKVIAYFEVVLIDLFYSIFGNFVSALPNFRLFS